MTYGQKGDGDGQWERLLAFIAALGQLRGGAIESQITTQEPVSIRTRVGLPLGNAGGFALGFCCTFLGLFMMSGSIGHLFDLDWDPRSWLFAWTGFVIVTWLVAAGVTRFLKKSLRIVQAFAAVAVMLVLGAAVGSLLLTAHERFGLELAGLVAGPAFVLGGAALAYNQAMDLISPYWRRSPFETDMVNEFFPIFRELLGVGQGQAEPAIRVVDNRYLVRRTRSGQVVMVDEDTDEDYELETITPEQGNLIWFGRFAITCDGLSIAGLTVDPAPMLPFEEGGRQLYLRKTMIRRLLARGSTENQVRVDGVLERGLGPNGWWHLRGAGASAEWAKSRRDILADTERMWHDIYKRRVPIPEFRPQAPDVELDDFEAENDARMAA